jgi:Ca-activated chloride channel family protein
MPTGDLYSLLSLQPTASPDDIKTAYRGAARRFHPDVNSSPLAVEEFKLIAEAYAILSDPAQRAAYDASLKQKGGGSLLLLTSTASRAKAPVLTEPQVLYALAEIRAALPVTDLPAPPVNLAIVIDRSTSMQGSRLDQVKAAIAQLIDHLRDSDLCSVITFSDKADVIISAQRGTPDQKQIAKAKVSTINAGGGTEILRGLLRGMMELHQNLSPGSVNHLMLLTDGQTYGDESDCILLAALAAADGVSISGLGIGDEWNDKFLDELTGLTGGTASFISSPDQVTQFMQDKVRGLGAAFGERLTLKVLPDQDIQFLQAFKVAPEPGPLQADDLTLPLGSLPKGQSIAVLLKFLAPPMAEGPRPIARLALTADVISLNRRGERATDDLVVTALPNFTPPPPPTALVEALGKLAQYRLQERAWQEAASGDMASATRLLSTLGTRLLASGQTDLARVALAEARRLENTQSLSEDAKKRLKYGTRALMLNAPPPPAKTRP